MDGLRSPRGGTQDVSGGLGRGARVDGVDGDLSGWQAHAWAASDEALRVRLVRGVEGALPVSSKLGHAPKEDVGGREEREPGVAVVSKPLTSCPGVKARLAS